MSKASPLVCVCIPTYNAESTVRETLESLLAQTYPNLLIRISDNASTDATLEIIKTFGDPRIAVYRSEKNVRAEDNFSRCIELGTGAYTAIFHADDVYESDMVAKQVAFLESHPAFGAVFTEATLIDEKGVPYGVIGRPPGDSRHVRQYEFSSLVKALLKHSNFLVCPSAMVRTCIYHEEIRRWRGDLFGSSADLDVWLRIAQAHPVAVLGERFLRYRVSRGQGSTTLIRERTERADFFRVMDHYLTQPEVQAILSEADVRHYGWLARTDRIIRAANLYLLDRTEAAALCQGLFSLDALRAGLTSRRGFVTLLGGAYLRLLLLLGMRKLGKVTVQRLKRVAQI